MNWKTLLIALLLLDFLVFSGYAMYEVGYIGIWSAGFENWGALQLLVDLVIACLLISLWIIADARQRNVNPWLYVVLTLAAGSVGPLLYLMQRERSRRVDALVGAGSS